MTAFQTLPGLGQTSKRTHFPVSVLTKLSSEAEVSGLSIGPDGVSASVIIR